MQCIVYNLLTTLWKLVDGKEKCGPMANGSELDFKLCHPHCSGKWLLARLSPSVLQFPTCLLRRMYFCSEENEFIHISGTPECQRDWSSHSNSSDLRTYMAAVVTLQLRFPEHWKRSQMLQASFRHFLARENLLEKAEACWKLHAACRSHRWPNDFKLWLGSAVLIWADTVC